MYISIFHFNFKSKNRYFLDVTVFIKSTHILTDEDDLPVISYLPGCHTRPEFYVLRILLTLDRIETFPHGETEMYGLVQAQTNYAHLSHAM